MELRSVLYENQDHPLTIKLMGEEIEGKLKEIKETSFVIHNEYLGDYERYYSQVIKLIVNPK
jgi:hypothetical protein